jgi:hypothetical protein
MFATFTSGDTVVFGLMPWLTLLALKLASQYEHCNQKPDLLFLSASCFSFGAIYWIKFSAILATGTLLASVAVAMLSSFSALRLISRLIVATAFFIAPIAALWLINQHAGGDIVSSHLSLGTNDIDIFTATFRAMSGVVIPFAPGAERILHAAERSELIQLLIYLPGLLLLLFVLSTTALRMSGSVAVLAAMLALIPIAVLSYLTTRSNYSFIVDSERHGGPYWIFIQILMIVALRRVASSSLRSAYLLLFAVFAATSYCFALALFAPYASVKQALQISSTEAAQPTGLYVPSLSPTKSAEVSLKLREIIRPDDVVVPATYWLGQEVWLELPGRLLPLTNFWEPLMQTHGRNRADYFSNTPFRSSAPLRVVLVAPDPYARQEYRDWIGRLKERFPQATNWLQVPVPSGDYIQVWTADLNVR